MTTRRPLAAVLGRASAWLSLVLALLLAGPLLTLAFGGVATDRDWRTASQQSSGIAPSPAAHREAIVQVYAGRAFGWRGAFADHTWLTVKAADADRYTRYEVIGWYAGGGNSVVSVSDRRAPDAQWYGNPARLIRELRGDEAELVIGKLPQAVAGYEYPQTYRAWPGPNSNTFIAHLGRAIPELRLALPSTAIGKDFVPIRRIVDWSPSHTGVQLSVYGLLGVIVGIDEGLEVNVLGLVAGIDWRRPALKLPGVGRVPGEG